MNKLEMHHTIMAAKARKELTWDLLSDLVGKAPCGWPRSATA